MSDYDYGSDEHGEQVDSDDDLSFVPSKRRFQYTTFGNEDDDSHQEQHGKEDAIYGSFLDNEDDRRKRPRMNNSGATPMFVKGTTEEKQQEEANEESETSQPKLSKEDEEEAKAEQARKEQQEAANDRFHQLLGRAKGDATTRRSMFRDDEKSPSAGLGFNKASASDQPSETDFTDSTPQFAGLGMPSQFGGIGSSKRTAAKPQDSTPMRVDPNLGKWEKHTKGIGMKLLSKMGYKGSGGLGAKRVRKTDSNDDAKPAAGRSTGISRPVEVKVRPANLGLGFGSFKEATALKSNQQIEAEVRGVELPKKKEKEDVEMSSASSSALPTTSELLQQQSWKKGARQASRKRQKRTIVPYKELLETQKQPVIIDMRGPAATESAESPEVKEVPLAEELLHNVTVLLNTYENKLHSASHFVQSTKRKLTSLQSDVNDMERRKREMEERTAKLQNVLQSVDEIDSLVENSTGDEATKRVQSLVQQLRDGFSEEERAALKFDQVVAPSLLGPMIQSRLKQWNPLGDSSSISEDLIVSTLSLGLGEDMNESLDTKRTVFANHIMPRVKKAFESTKWNPIDAVENGIQLYEAVLRAAERVSPPKHEANGISHDDAHVLPSNAIDESGDLSLTEMVKQEIMIDTIAPKLSRTLSQWNPLLDESGKQVEGRIDLWILPWFPYLDHPVILPQLVTDVRRKLRSALSYLQRNVHDDKTFCSASLQMMKPWVNIIKRETIQELTSKYVTPRLARALSRIAVSQMPKTQHWSTLELLFQWSDSDLLAKQEYLSLIEGELLSNWAGKLYEWLASKEGTGLASLAEFYSLWKIHVFRLDDHDATNDNTLSVHTDEMICRMFYSGLVMIKAAQDEGVDLQEFRPSPLNYQTVFARRTKEERLKLEKELRRMDMEPSSNGVPDRMRRRREGEPATFRDVVEEFAKERDVLFRPRMGANSTKDGKQVFLFGDVPVYFDSNVIFALQQSEWRPLSLDQLAGTVA